MLSPQLLASIFAWAIEERRRIIAQHEALGQTLTEEQVIEKFKADSARVLSKIENWRIDHPNP